MRTEIATSRGLAWADLELPGGGRSTAPHSLLVLGHGAGGGVTAPDIVAVAAAARAAGVATALVTQPYRVAGRRSPAPAAHLDGVWREVLAWLTDADANDGTTTPPATTPPATTPPATTPPAATSPAGRARVLPAGVPLVVGGRSSGARVACRTAVACGAVGTVALAFPTHPPGRPERSRADELRTGLPTLVVNGDRDPFGLPPALPGVELAIRPGDGHDLRRDPAGVAALVVGWLRGRGWAGD